LVTHGSQRVRHSVLGVGEVPVIQVVFHPGAHDLLDHPEVDHPTHAVHLVGLDRDLDPVPMPVDVAALALVAGDPMSCIELDASGCSADHASSSSLSIMATRIAWMSVDPIRLLVSLNTWTKRL